MVFDKVSYTLLLLLLINTTGRTQSGTWQHLSVGAGTAGVTLGYETNGRDSSRFSYRLHGSYLGYQQARDLPFDAGTVLTINPDVRKLHFGVKAYFYPLQRRAWLSLSGGVGFDVAQSYQLQISTETGFNSDGLIINAADFGVIDTGISWQRLMPALGVRFGSSPSKHRFTVSGELGVLYMGSPALRMDYEGFLETTTLDQELIKIERNMRGYRYYPIVELSFGYRL